jgi:hypothetical protein
MKRMISGLDAAWVADVAGEEVKEQAGAQEKEED